MLFIMMTEGDQSFTKTNSLIEPKSVMAIQTSQHRQISYNIGDIGLGEQQTNEHWD